MLGDAGENGRILSKLGPWGQLEMIEILVAPPDENITHCPGEIPVWLLPGYNQDGLQRLLRSAELKPDQYSQLIGVSECAVQPEPFCRISPDAAMVESLSQTSRGVLYRELARYPENIPQFNAMRRRKNAIEGWFDAANFRPEVEKKVRELLYPRGEYLNFSDLEMMCARLSTPEDRAAMQKAVGRTHGLLVRLRVPPGADVEQLASYWSVGRRQKDVRPLLESVARYPGGATIDISHLLPMFARSRLYTYPRPRDPAWNCHWASLNFFTAAPDPRIPEPETVVQILREDYDRVEPKDARLGDVILFRRPDGDILHTMVYIADEVVFTKNGMARQRPFILSDLSEMRDQYFSDTGVEELYYRRRLP